MKKPSNQNNTDVKATNKLASLSRATLVLWVSLITAFLIGLTITAVLMAYSQQQQTEQLSQEFNFATQQVANNIRSRIVNYQTVMRGVRGYYQGSQVVTASEFKKYVEDLKINNRYSGIQGVGLVSLVSQSDKADHELAERVLHHPNYSIRPAGEREMYAPIVRMEPANADNLKAIGYDVLTIPAARAAMEKARDLDMVAITQPITLLQDAGKLNTYAFVMYLPIYSNDLPSATVAERRMAIEAWVDVPFRMNDLMAGLSGEFADDVLIDIYDGDITDNNKPMYRSRYTAPSIQATTPLTLISYLDIGGRVWTVRTQSTPAFEQRVINPRQSAMIGLAGVLLSTMLAWITWLLVSGRQRAQRRYQQLFAQAGEGVIILNQQHRIVDCNHSAKHMLGFSQEALLHVRLTDLLAKSELPRFNDFFKQLSSGVTTLSEWQYVRQDGVMFTAEVSASQLDHQNYFLILRDLTERKKAEQRIQRLNHLYLALSETNQAIVRMDDAHDLFPLVCRCAVEFGEMKMAWIGQQDALTGNIVPIAMHATNANYLEVLNANNQAIHLAEGGPPRQAMADNKPMIINDMFDPAMQTPWHVQAQTFGWGSVACFPIQHHGQQRAVLTVCHDAIDAFDQEAINLLMEMSGDISFALDNFDRETQRLQAERLLIENEHKLSLILNNVGAYIYLKDTQGRYLFANQAVLNLWQVQLEDVVGYGDEKFFNAETTRQIRAIDKKVLVDGETVELEETNTVEQTGETSVYWSIKLPLKKSDGSIYGLCGISSDVTQHKRVEADLRIAAISFESQVGMLIMDAQRNTLRVNQAYSKISGYSSDEVVGLPPKLLCDTQHSSEFYSQIWQAVAQHGGWEGEVWNQRKDMQVYPQHLMLTAVKDPTQLVTHYVASMTDVTESKAAALEIEHLAYYDPLTQLPNRRLLLERLNHALAATERTGQVGALLYLDLDHFKMINDSKGHDVGDLLLKQVAARLLACVRADDTVARLGGDEYVIMLEGLSKAPLEAAAQTEHVAHKIQTTLSGPYEIGQYQFSMSASIGLVLFSGQQQSSDELLKQADIAMYHTKKSGRDGFRFFDPLMQNTINARVLLEEELRAAITAHQFKLYYQVQVDKHGVAFGAEALIRWLHPVRGAITPVHFIPLAEETGLILPIGQWVLNAACAQLKQWERDAATQHLSISINVSAKQFHQPDFADQVQAAVEYHQIKPMLLKLELTESMLVDNIEHIISVMHTLRKVGVRFELDDFGTGYSSLQYLKRLPLHVLKIDQSFVRDITTDKSDKAIVKTIVKMAQGLGLEVIAEGVESKAQLEQLRKMGCTNYQGYLFSQPVPIEEFTLAARGQHTM